MINRLRSIWIRCSGMFRARDRDGFEEELASHIGMHTEDGIRSGLSYEEARRQALIRLGGAEQVRQAYQEQRVLRWLETLISDTRFGLRQLRHNRGFALTAVITLGLGIGATATIFSAVSALLLKPLPYRDPNGLVWVSNYWPKLQVDRVISPNFMAARSETKSFAQLAAFTDADSNLTGTQNPTRVAHVSVTVNLLPMLGETAQIGRVFSGKEDKGNGANVVMLSDRLWRSQFHAKASVLGQVVKLDDVEETVIGVLPKRFRFPDAQLEPDVYTPLGLDPARSANDRRVSLLSVIGRLRPGTSPQLAQVEMLTFFLARTKSYPAGFAHMAVGQTVSVVPLRQHMVGDIRKPLLILFSSVGLVLVIACANVANLQLARLASRRHEIAVRGALGASRLRIVRQFVVESLLLSLTAAGLGLLISIAITSFVRSLQMPEASLGSFSSSQLAAIPFGKLSGAIAVDGWVLGFTMCVALITTTLAGLIPAIGGSRSDLRGAMQATGLHGSSGRDQQLLRHSLLLAEVGLAVVLLACAGLLIRSFITVLQFNAGFTPHNRLTGVTLLNSSRYSSDASIKTFLDRLFLRLSALPGVSGVTETSLLPLQTSNSLGAITFEGVPAPPMGMRPTVSVVSITPDYFKVVGTQIFEGRTFDQSDSEVSLPVTIVNRSFAHRFFPQGALGKRFHSMAWGPEHPGVTIVGIADDVRRGGLEQDAQPEIFVPMTQLPQRSIGIVLQTETDPSQLANALRSTVADLDPDQPVFNIETMDQQVSNALAPRRLIMLLSTCFALLAVILCAVGVYGVLSYTVTQRMHELGIRCALGASRAGLFGLVVSEAGRLILLGGILGLTVSFEVCRLLSTLLVGITSRDATTFALAWAFMTVVALIASTVAATKAARTDLLAALRNE